MTAENNAEKQHFEFLSIIHPGRHKLVVEARLGNLSEEFGQSVRSRRKARGLTQAQLADATSMSEEWIRRIERGVGSPSFDAIEALAGALGASVAELFAPMSARAQRATRIAALLAEVPDKELAWVESIVRAALARP